MKDYSIPINECYRRLFKAATPSADFDKLVDNAVMNDFGYKEIPYMDYELSLSNTKAIMDTIIKEYKITGYMKERFKTIIYLGCSPKFKQ